DSLKPNKSYYITKGRLNRINPNYSSVHKEAELTFKDSTIIKETEHEVPTDKFSDGFSLLEHADKLPNGVILDLICVLVSVNPIIENENSKRREIIVTNEFMEHTVVTLWGNFAENDGAFLEKLQDDKPILALCDVRVSIYKGRFGISTIPVSSFLINPMFQKANDLQAWREIIKADNKDITITPTKCHKKVKFIEETAACTNCNSENVEYEMRYCLRLEVCAGERRARVILFETDKYLLGCSIQEYIESTSVNREECYYYRKLVLSKDKQFNFLVRIEMNDSNHRRSIIAEEIHPAEEQAPIIVNDEVKSVRMYKKRAKKMTDGVAQAQVKLKKPRTVKK
ncbi:hypothetical protein KY289_009488, partial [Solanum tuberosum]